MPYGLRNLLFTAACLASAPGAFAAVTVGSAPVSTGYFEAPECVPEANPKLQNECICKAQINKAQVTGLAAPIATVVNNQLSQVPEQLASESCSGKPAATPEPDIRVNEVSADYKVIYQTPTILTVLLNYNTFGAGAAHNITGSEGYTFDLATGKTVVPTLVLTPEQLAKANEFVRQELSKKYGEALLEEAKARTEPYLTDAGCENCTLYYSAEGWNIQFQPYAVAPYSAGEPVITLPTTIIPDPETLLATRK